MNELPGHQQTAPPQYSSDGRWWWDGQQWMPAQQAPARREYPPPPPLASPTGGAQPQASEGAVRHWPTGFPRPTAFPGIPIPAMAVWALGFGVATIVASLLVWALSGFLPPHQALATAIMIILVLLAFVLGQLAVVFGMRSQWQVARSPKPMGGAAIATAGWICGLCGLALLVIWFVFVLSG
jgi:hypothetical protein